MSHTVSAVGVTDGRTGEMIVATAVTTAGTDADGGW